MSNTLANGARRAIKTPFSLSNHVRFLTIAAPRAQSFTKPWTCVDCRHSRTDKAGHSSASFSRAICSSHPRLDARARTPIDPKPRESSSEPIVTPTADLPSQSDQRRWQVSRRMAQLMDSILARASVAGHHINIYTGTDYSGIEAIKSAITEQEEKVETCHETIDTARSTHREAHSKQASSQKEIVSLLERKSSWSPEDLERYMSLVRSEHTDEQAVQAAKDGLAAAERDLENARADLERLERKQYHEEQIWSDTIRRNSTWVTFGLMGLNILLLLTQIAIFEPYRRKKIVKEVQRALDEKTMLTGTANVERQTDEVIEPASIPFDSIQTPLGHSLPIGYDRARVAAPVSEMLPEEVSHTPSTTHVAPKSGRWEAYKDMLQDLFSERVIQVKKVDITTTALQGAATGVATIGLLFVLWRPK